MSSTLVSDKPWERSIATSREYKYLLDLLGFPLERDAGGVYWPGSSRAKEYVEQLLRWGKYQAKSDDPIKALFVIKDKIKDMGTNAQGESLARQILMEAEFEELSRQSSDRKEESETKEEKKATEENKKNE